MICGVFVFQLLANYWQKVFLKVILKPISMPERGAESYYLYSTYFEKNPCFFPATPCRYLAVEGQQNLVVNLWSFFRLIPTSFGLHFRCVFVVPPQKRSQHTKKAHWLQVKQDISPYDYNSPFSFISSLYFFSSNFS